MDNLIYLGAEIVKIRDAVDSLEVKGGRNATLVAYIFQSCNDVIERLNAISAQSDQEGDRIEPID